ncbi:hypothetical protein I317_00721 [Kwoniella heveanensis CBS 569]|nr:hypothetical protein I317_00721 [Kwoniella heveanensis CBS 569]
MARPDPPTDFHPHPHLRLLLPSSTPPIHLEARLYLPTPLPPSIKTHANILGEYSTVPKKLEDIDSGLRDALRDLGIERVVVASHPWGRLGGDMLDPVITSHLISAIYHPYHSTTTDPSSIEGAKTAVISYNVRGVGLSGGSQPWIGVGNDPEDFAHIERLGTALMGDSVREVFRYGYSWGSLLATLAPVPTDSSTTPLKKTLLVSPPITIFKGLTFFSSNKFHSALTNLSRALSSVSIPNEGQRPVVWVVYGNKDNFTGPGAYAHFKSEMEEKEGVVRCFEVEDADHLWRRDEGEKLREIIRDWLDA